MLKYILEEKINANRFVKVDDDAYVNAQKYISSLRALLSHPFDFICHAVEHSHPLRKARLGSQSSKWILPKWMYPRSW